MREALLAAVFLLAGCIAAPAELPETIVAEPEEVASAREAGSSPLPPQNSTTEDGAVRAVANATSFLWRSDRTYGDLALGLHVAAAAGETKCAIKTAMGRVGGSAGFQFFTFAIADEAVRGAGGGGSGTVVDAHVGDVSASDVLLPSSGEGATSVGWGLTIDEAGADLVLAGLSTAPVDVDFVDNGSVLVNVTCDDPILFSDFAYSHEVALYRTGYGTDGAGASILFAGGVGAQESVRLEATMPRVVAALASGGIGQARIVSPEEDVTAASDPIRGARLLLEGGPGTWSLGVDAMAGPVPAFGGILGLAPVASWDEIPPSE